MQQAVTLNCPMCGAPTETDAARCLYCDARLATIACPRCFGMMFVGSDYCSHCGARAARQTLPAQSQARCPRCRVEMDGVTIGAETLRECARCGGLWVEAEAFERICADREEQTAVLGAAAFASKPSIANIKSSHAGQTDKVRYVPCPQCAQLMNRVNFAHCSGVIVDVCKGHGTWFDRDELRAIVEFIRAGGLVASRAREKQQILDMQRQLREQQLGTPADHFIGATRDDEEHASILAAARGLLKILRD